MLNDIEEKKQNSAVPEPIKPDLSKGSDQPISQKTRPNSSNSNTLKGIDSRFNSSFCQF